MFLETTHKIFKNSGICIYEIEIPEVVRGGRAGYSVAEGNLTPR
jgi:hypothetical protein